MVINLNESKLNSSTGCPFTVYGFSSLAYMDSLKTLVFYKDSKLVEIENNAFYYNLILEEIVFPPNLKEFL